MALGMSDIIRALPEGCNDIPMPIVLLNRWTLLLGVVAAVVLQQPLITTALFAILAGAAIFGSRGSLIYQIGSRVFARRNATAETEDRRLMRFNNTLGAIFLGLAQIAFLAHAPLAGWILASFAALAAAIALAGFCVGCYLYVRFKIERYRLFGS
jgi:hypothetical protein